MAYRLDCDVCGMTVSEARAQGESFFSYEGGARCAAHLDTDASEGWSADRYGGEMDGEKRWLSITHAQLAAIAEDEAATS